LNEGGRRGHRVGLVPCCRGGQRPCPTARVVVALEFYVLFMHYYSRSFRLTEGRRRQGWAGWAKRLAVKIKNNIGGLQWNLSPIEFKEQH
jgi:hypothetical protein